MSQDNRQNYGAPPAGGAYPNNQQQPYQNQPNQYASYDMQNNPIDPNQPPQNYQQQPQNQGATQPNSYPPAQPGSYDRSNTNQSYSTYPTQNYTSYNQGAAPPTPQPPTNYQQNLPLRPEANAQNYPGQGQFQPAPSAERHQNTFSHHETSAPVGIVNQQNYGNQRPEGAQRQDPNFPVTNQPSQFRPEAAQQPYAQPPRGDVAGMGQLNPPATGPVANDTQVISGFLGGAPNQSSAQMPGQEMGRTGLQEPNPGFDFGGTMNNPGAATGAAGQPPMGVGMGGQGADPQSMDIGALNRMAEYYATNSDYPKVRKIIT